MQDQIMNEGVEDSGESFVKDHGFAAVPIHFKPKEGAEKLIALVIPGIEPPLAFFKVSGDSPENVTFEEVDGHTDTVSNPSSDEVAEENVEQDIDEASESEEAKDTDDVTEDSDLNDEEDEADTESEHPHVDSNDQAVAGFLLGSEENMPLVIVVNPKDGESTTDALKRAGNENPEHFPGSLEDATALLGKSPLIK